MTVDMRISFPLSWCQTKQSLVLSKSLLTSHAARDSGKLETVEDDRHKKTDLIEHPEVINQVGLLVNEPSAAADCSLSSHPKTAYRLFFRPPDSTDSTLAV